MAALTTAATAPGAPATPAAFCSAVCAPAERAAYCSTACMPAAVTAHTPATAAIHSCASTSAPATLLLPTQLAGSDAGFNAGLLNTAASHTSLQCAPPPSLPNLFRTIITAATGYQSAPQHFTTSTGARRAFGDHALHGGWHAPWLLPITCPNRTLISITSTNTLHIPFAHIPFAYQPSAARILSEYHHPAAHTLSTYRPPTAAPAHAETQPMQASA